MILVLDNTDAKIIQLKRIGMYNNIIPKDVQQIKYREQILLYGKSPANRPVALFMLKTKDFKNNKNKLPLDLHKGKKILSDLLGGTYKFVNIGCHMIDGHDPILGKQFHEIKYPRSITYKRINKI